MMETSLGKALVVVAWHDPKQIALFKKEWDINDDSPIILQEDKHKEGCAVTKNKGIKRAYDEGADVICVLDDDCHPGPDEMSYSRSLRNFIHAHVEALQPQPVQRVISTTSPNSRGTPYRHTSMLMPVAASLGFWTNFPDYDAITALHLGETAAVKFNQQAIFGNFFPGCGMNFAFCREWIDCAVLIDVPRWDDIWCFWVWQKIAYEKGFCFNLKGPVVRHSRQSNVFQNLREEAPYLEQNETLWEKIAKAPHGLPAEVLRNIYIDPILNRKDGDKNG
jgi:glycosyltransferase involved in cell wall biosynthesis